MTFRYFNRVRGSGAARAFDSDALAWEAAVAANGGSVSLNQRILIDQLIYSLKSAGCWSLMDDAWLLVAENAQQALTSLKQKRLATAVNSPTFGTNAGYTFDGATNYIDTGFICSSHGVAMTTNDIRLGVYERVNINQSTYAAGVLVATNRRLDMRNRSGGGSMLACANSLSSTFTLPIADSRGLSVVSRKGATVTDVVSYKNGDLLVRAADPTGIGSSLPNLSLYFGATNNLGGGAATFRATTLGWVSVGAALSAGQELAEYNALQAYMTAKGANV
jgi:hypothetical protein